MMNNNERSRYAFSCIVLGIFSLLIAALLSLGIIWVRQDTSRVANQVRELEFEMSGLDRKVRFLKERYARIHSPDRLMQSVHAAMKQPSDAQVIWVQPNAIKPEPRETISWDPLAVNLDLALLD